MRLCLSSLSSIVHCCSIAVCNDLNVMWHKNKCEVQPYSADLERVCKKNMKHSVMSVKVWDALKYTIADYSSRRALRLEQGNGLKCTESYSQNREGAVQSLKCTFKCSQAEPMQRNANQCCKREERC